MTSTSDKRLFVLADDGPRTPASLPSPDPAAATPPPPQALPSPFPYPAQSPRLSQSPAGDRRNVAPNLIPSSTVIGSAGTAREDILGSGDVVPAPFPWARNRRAHVLSLAELSLSGVHVVSGDVRCKRCGSAYKVELPLWVKYGEIRDYIARHKGTMHDRAPAKWMNPPLFSCRICERRGCVKPVISAKKRSINWLFLLLSEMLGFCNLAQLKYFCKHTNNHRTGAKDRVLYLTYLCLCKQLAGDRDEGGLFDR
ncbi:hypothetical protein H6P81_001574 [Aristolochia fimbriata]|uniref:DUF7086 domain-containing protein n=1 Tax=Aristolochia fimbriata TaxID=158543 RepID=A0AAV7FB58_ARIFI|nr:hypothetical protein H6P81_001574 [Aristolochia fimbriata]